MDVSRDENKFIQAFKTVIISRTQLNYAAFISGILEHTFADELREKDDKERRHQIVYALYVSTGWMTDGPNVQDTFKHLKYYH